MCSGTGRVPSLMMKSRAASMTGVGLLYPNDLGACRKFLALTARQAWRSTLCSGSGSKTRYRGLARVGWSFTFTAAAYNLIRLPKLLAT